MPTDIPSITNQLASAAFHVVDLIDPNRIQFYCVNMANQINEQSVAARKSSGSPTIQVKDLSDWITDIIIETTAQGSSLLEVHVIDPAWTLFQRDPTTGTSFFDVDPSGYIWPPIEVQFPPNVSDAKWRVCQLRPSTDLNQANVIITFEDKSAAILREHSGAQQSFPNETRAQFIQRLVKEANTNPQLPTDGHIRLEMLLDPKDFTLADLNANQRLPTSATQPYAPPARKDPKKRPHPLISTNLPLTGSAPPPGVPPGLIISIAGSLALGSTLVPNPGSNPIQSTNPVTLLPGQAPF